MSLDLSEPQSASTRAVAEATEWLGQCVRDILGSSCKAAWLSGSFAYGGAVAGGSDVDLVVVLDETVSVPADAETMALIRRSVDAYLAIHARLGLKPDLDFPGEFLVPHTVEEAIGWRGFTCNGSLTRSFPTVESSDYWLDRPDRWFHAWLSMTTFSRFLAGSRDYHAAVKLAGWKAIASFLLLRTGIGWMSADGWLPALAQFGAKQSYRAFWAFERDWIRQALDELEAEGAVDLAGDRVVPVLGRLRDWERRVCATIEGGRPAGLLLDVDLHRNIANHAAPLAGAGRNRGLAVK